MSITEDILKAFNSCSEEEQRFILDALRKDFPIHPLEKRLNATAEVILEAISRASDLTMRGIRGIIAEASFKHNVIDKLPGIKDVTPEGSDSYDYLIEDRIGQIRIQVKIQRSEKGIPKISGEKYVVETQRTRTGTNRKTGEKTRPYRFGEFDLIAVSLHPSTNSWNAFLYTVAEWLLPDKNNPMYLRTLQPVSFSPNDEWTDSFPQAIQWLRSNQTKKIADKY